MSEYFSHALSYQNNFPHQDYSFAVIAFKRFLRVLSCVILNRSLLTSSIFNKTFSRILIENMLLYIV